MSSDLENIKQLRRNTGAGFKDCNQAIKESKGDLDKAIEKVIRETTSGTRIRRIQQSQWC